MSNGEGAPFHLLFEEKSSPPLESANGGEQVEINPSIQLPEAAVMEEEKPASPPTSPTSSLPSPLLPLQDFMTALNMQPAGERHQQPELEVSSLKEAGMGAEQEATAQSSLATTIKEEKVVMTLGPGPKEILIEKFKKDPNGVLNLLQSALSMEKLSNLLKDEHRNDSELMRQLQNRLEASYHTLRECEGVKTDLSVKISETNQRIGVKRKHMENLRGELRILGDEELKLKRRRDVSNSEYSEFKKRLNCSTEALEQISQITMATSFSPSPERQGDRVNGDGHNMNDDNNNLQTQSN